MPSPPSYSLFETHLGSAPHAFFEWSEGSSVAHLFRYLLLGRGDTPPVVREFIRKVEPDPVGRPGIHVS